MSYAERGYRILRGAIPLEVIDELDGKIIGLVREWTGHNYESTRSTAFASALQNDRDLERALYDRVRDFDWLQTFSLHPEITRHVKAILEDRIGLMQKIPLRIDLPRLVRELAVWHQDHWYVGGNTDIVTAWIPLQDTSFIEGCLLVMPGSQELGVLAHDRLVLGKRHFPSGIFERDVRYIEMKRGDLLLFNSLLLHSSGVNLSDHARLSVQARYSRMKDPTDPSMGAVIPVEA